MNKISRWLINRSKGWVVLVGLLVFVGFLGWVLPNQAALSEVYSAGVGSPDGSFFYSAETLYTFADAYGEAGRQQYVRERFTFDIVWPLAYMLFLTTAMSWLAGKITVPTPRFLTLNILPLLGGLFDYLENISASIVMVRFPAQTPIIDRLASIFTMLKWTCIRGSFLLLLIGLLLALWQWVQNKKRPS